MNATIYYMSGTGNSYHIANELTQTFDSANLQNIASVGQQPESDRQVDAIGFVFPCYCHDMPPAFRRFLEALTIHNKGVYTFAIVTHNGRAGESLDNIKKLLSKKNIKLNYGEEVLMPGNSVITKDFTNPDWVEKLRLEESEKLLPQIREALNNKTNFIRTTPLSGRNKMEGRFYRVVLKHYYKLPKHFNSSDACNGCGTCEKACAFNNISIVNSKPQWKNNCETCLACFHWCPKHAINLDDYSQEFKRYTHPKVNLKAIMS